MTSHGIFLTQFGLCPTLTPTFCNPNLIRSQFCINFHQFKKNVPGFKIVPVAARMDGYIFFSQKVAYLWLLKSQSSILYKAIIKYKNSWEGVERTSPLPRIESNIILLKWFWHIPLSQPNLPYLEGLKLTNILSIPLQTWTFKGKVWLVLLRAKAYR